MSAKKKRIKTNPNKSSSSEHNAKHSLSERVFALPLLQSGLMENTSFSRLSSTSQTFYSLAKPDLKRRAADVLLKHILLGEQTQACAMISANPKLLLVKARAKDYSERIVIATPFQAAIGAGDKPMWEMMLPYLEELEPGEALRQFHEWFPEGMADTPVSELQADYDKIAQAIITDAEHSLSVIEEFRKNITSQKEIRQGKHFNFNHLIAAEQTLSIYNNRFPSGQSHDLFIKQVIHYLEGHMTTYDAQAHCSARDPVFKEDTFARTLEFFNGEKFLFNDQNNGTSYNLWRQGASMGHNHWLNTYIDAKTEALSGLRESLEQKCVSSAVLSHKNQ